MFTCVKCGVTKPTEEFYKYKLAARGHRPDCKDCTKAANKKWAEANPERVAAANQRWHEKHADDIYTIKRAHWLRRGYGMTLQEFEQRRADQGNACPMCGAEFVEGLTAATTVPHVDHAHDTGTVRDLLCTSCNRKFGWFEKNRERILTYDRKWHGK